MIPDSLLDILAFPGLPIFFGGDPEHSGFFGCESECVVMLDLVFEGVGG